MGRIVRIGGGNTGEHVLIGLARQQVTVVQRLLAEVGQQRIPRRISLDPVALDQRDLRFGTSLRLALACSLFSDGLCVGCRHGDPPESSCFYWVFGAFNQIWFSASSLTLHIVSE